MEWVKAFRLRVSSRVLIQKGYDLANQTAYLDDMLRWSLDWLMKVSGSIFVNTRVRTF